MFVNFDNISSTKVRTCERQARHLIIDFINACCKFQDQGGITIGDGCFLGHNVTIATLNHELNPKYRANIVPNSVQIGKNVWIGSNSIILSGVEIGDGAVVGAGSVVTKNVPENTVVIGNPARVIKKIDA